MRRWVGPFFAALLSVIVLGGEAPCPIVPTPKVYQDHGGRAELVAGSAAIVLAEAASEVERYAAERLQTRVATRFGQRLPVLAEGNVEARVRQVVLLGQRATHSWLDRLCREKQVDLSPQSPGHDGFVIEAVGDGDRLAVLLGGSDARGVVYAQEAFFDLLRREDGAVVFPRASVRDWPSIAWRGRPHFYLRHHLEPGVLDAYVRARVNFIDVRDAPGGKALYGFPPDHPIDGDVVRRIVAGAHRRGVFVYGTVQCAVGPQMFDAVMSRFEQLLALGVDGLWISFDDRGEGQGVDALIARVLGLGARHGIAGWQIATTPPMGSYGHARSEFNRRAAQIPGFADVRWFFTQIPLERQAAAAREIGLTRKVSWWHNWPRITGGFLHEGYLGATMRAGGEPAYVDLHQMTPMLPWWGRTNQTLGAVPQFADAVMMWGLMPEDYSTRVHGIWTWHPEKHDWSRTRQAVYAEVFGAALAPAAAAFDDKLASLRAMYVLPKRGAVPGDDWPPRLVRPSDRPAALKLLDETEAPLKALEEQARAASLLPAERLQRLYLEPMRATVACARKLAAIDFLDYSLPDIERRVDELLAGGKTREAEDFLAGVRTRALPGLAALADELPGLKGVREHAAAWEKRLSSAAYWAERDARRRAPGAQPRPQ